MPLPDGGFNVAWALRLPDASEYLMFLYGLNPQAGAKAPLKYDFRATHEFTSYALNPETPVDFTTNLWSQSTLEPIQPPTRAFQLLNTTDRFACAGVTDIIQRVVDGRVPPDSPQVWLARFPDAIDLSKPLMNYDDPDADLSVLDHDALHVEEIEELPIPWTQALWQRCKPYALTGLCVGLWAMPSFWPLGVSALSDLGAPNDETNNEGRPEIRGILTSDGAEHLIAIVRTGRTGYRRIYTLDDKPVVVYPKDFKPAQAQP